MSEPISELTELLKSLDAYAANNGGRMPTHRIHNAVARMRAVSALTRPAVGEPKCPACGWLIPDTYASRYCGSCAQDMIYAEMKRPAVGEDVVEHIEDLLRGVYKRAWGEALEQREIEGDTPHKDSMNEGCYQCLDDHRAAIAALSPDMQEVERLRDALVKVKDRCWEADEANWQHDILSIVVPITDALKGQLTRGERND
jgi:hypothetical protein